jgi:coenzyme F420 hydrogenase subunit gamma
MSFLEWIFGKKDASPAAPQKPATAPKSADVASKTTETKKEVKPVADKITVGYTHLSGCTGGTVALADNYAGLLTLLDKYVDLKYMPTLADARHIQKVDVSFVDGSVCIND